MKQARNINTDLELEPKDLYSMQLHDIAIVEGSNHMALFTSVMRVPGGWIYRSYDKGSRMMSNTFVPWHTEFRKVPE